MAIHVRSHICHRPILSYVSNTSTVYTNQLGRPIRTPYVEEHLDPYTIRLAKLVYTVPTLLWEHTVQRTHSKNRHADMSMQ